MRRLCSLVLAILVCVSTESRGAEFGEAEPASAKNLKQLSFEELLEQEVSLVTRTPERLSRSPSAVQVITGDDIRRSGATSIPEALRLASNLHVSQVDTRNWSINARGFNNPLANKLLVMIDGRSVYTPLFAGVFWDVQNALLADVDRIEVVSGPGATLWGANAVNGVVNIVTRGARDTQGMLVEGGGGSLLQDYGAVRYGGHVGSNFFYRVYGFRFDRNPTVFPNGRDATDAWEMTQGGFRADWLPSEANTITIQGDFYSGENEGEPGVRSAIDGQNLLGRWTHALYEESDFTLQFYVDRTWRNVMPRNNEELRTYDIDFQHRLPLGSRNNVTWGLGYRLMQDDVKNSASLAFFPARRDLHLFSGFLQDEVVLVPDRLKLTVGSKVEHNDYTGFEFEPSGRLAWLLDERHTLWSAVSRAVRAPSRIDTDVLFPTAGLAGTSDFKAEELLAFELGYRVTPHRNVSLSLATFYHMYENIRSIEPAPGGFEIQNKNEAESWGVELSGTIQATDWWRMRGGYTYFDRDVRQVRGGMDINDGTSEGNDPRNQAVVQSMFNLPGRVELDFTFRYVDALPSPHVPAYFTVDTRVAWHPTENLELSVVGQNLWDDQHPEFGAAGTRQEIPRSIFGKVTWRF
ncbi:MAG TPA: TonB-dependent receptor [Verrucomicrobiae bacterium]|nr:TonB-dependent receptor [Verrucomicrobiae bacterium]